MNNISDYFQGIGAKRLSEVEINPKKSNQHEFGSNKFRSLLGSERTSFNVKIIYLNDDPEATLIEEGKFSWYDSREKNLFRSPEYRLYYSANSIVTEAEAGDLMIVGKKNENELMIIIAGQNSTSEKQMMWLFGLQQVASKYIVKEFKEEKGSLNFAGKFIIETLGIEIKDEAPDYLEELLNKYKDGFPGTAVFSKYARSTLENKVSAVEEPDKTLITWLEREELLFRTLEKHFVSQRLASGFGDDGRDVDEFVSYSLSVHNRRKSRAGHSFENHLAAVFNENKIAYSKGKKTERNNKPDFLFPGFEQYKNSSFESGLLTMLGVKTTAKDRWRQVLSEADRIPHKHLITLQPAISENQTDEMREKNLQLIIPEPLMNTYSEAQCENLINLSQFIGLVRDRQV